MGKLRIHFPSSPVRRRTVECERGAVHSRTKDPQAGILAFVPH